MNSIGLVYLILAAITFVGCTTTQNYYPAEPQQLEETPMDEELLVKLMDGTKLKTSEICVEGDSLFLFDEPLSSHPLVVHRDEVASVAMRRTDGRKTAALVGGIVGFVVMAWVNDGTKRPLN